MKTMKAMKTIETIKTIKAVETIKSSTYLALRTCACCKRQLPVTDFYIIAGGHPDHYCKYCRRKANRERYYTRRRNELKRASYLVITDISDKDLRMALIKKALNTVRQSIERKRRREWALIDAEA